MSASHSQLVVETSFPTTYARTWALYARTYALGPVHHAAYAVYFREGRSHYKRHIKSDYSELKASGYY